MNWGPPIRPLFTLITSLRSLSSNTVHILRYWGIGTSTYVFAAAAAKSLQSCPTLCDPRDGSPPGSPIPGILQARTLEWVAISFSNAWKWKGKVKSLSCVLLLATPWTAAYQAPPPMGFSRQEYWSGLPSPSPLSTFTPALFPVCSSFPLPAPSLYLWACQLFFVILFILDLFILRLYQVFTVSELMYLPGEFLLLCYVV